VLSPFSCPLRPRVGVNEDLWGHELG
jgi:hypothetical protein